MNKQIVWKALLARTAEDNNITLEQLDIERRLYNGDTAYNSVDYCLMRSNKQPGQQWSNRWCTCVSVNEEMTMEDAVKHIGRLQKNGFIIIEEGCNE